jgi:hypothetical protein
MKKLENIKKQLERVKGEVEKLKGFKYVRTPCAMTHGIYINRKKGVVVKQNYICHEDTEFPRVTTIACRGWNIQPLCKPFKSHKQKLKAYYRFLDRHDLPDHGCGDHDIHEENIMLYRNQVVAIDW